MYRFLCTYPYIKKIPFWKRPFIRNRYDEIPSHYEKEYRELCFFILQWMSSRGFFKLERTGDGSYICTHYDDVTYQQRARSYHAISVFNMRTLLSTDGWKHLCGLVMDGNNERGTTDFIQLITTLISLYPVELINTIITKVYLGTASIVEERDRWSEWVQFHQDHPYVWILIFCNVLINRYGDPRLMYRGNQ